MNHLTLKWIKCPKCKGKGYKYLFEGRYYFECLTCGFKTILRLLNK